MEPHQDKLLDVLGAATVELLRLDASGAAAPDSALQPRAYRRVARRAAFVLVAHLAATLAGLDPLNEFYVYAALVGIGIFPSPMPSDPSRPTETEPA